MAHHSLSLISTAVALSDAEYLQMKKDSPEYTFSAQKLTRVTVLLATVLCSTASAHHYICEYCGSGANASNMPQPRNSCQRNPHGKVHSWVMDIEDSRSHRCICAYCGAGVTSAHMPQPGNSCYRNPEGGKYHRWIQKD